MLIRAEAAHLHYLAGDDRREKLSFVTLADLAREMLGVPERTVRERVSLHRVLVAHPAVERLFLEGHLSACRILAIAPVLVGPEADAWIRRAMQVPVRQLRREVRKRSPCAYHEERHGRRRIEMDVPIEIKASWDEFIDIGRKVIGYDAPPGEVMEAILAESGRAGRGDARDRKRTRSGGATRSCRAMLRLVRPCDPISQNDLADARAVLTDVARFRRRLSRFSGVRDRGNGRPIGPPASPTGPYPSPARATGPVGEHPSTRHHPVGSLQALEELRAMHNPLRVMMARLVRSMRRTRCDIRLGFDSLENFIEKCLDLSERLARELVSESYLFEHYPELEQAYIEGKISIAKAHMIRRLAGNGDIDRWIDRAHQTFHRPFEQECRLITLLRSYDPKIARHFAGPFPHHGMERILADEVCRKHRLTDKALERELKARGVRPLPARGSLDPAANPPLMRRLQVLAQLLCTSAQQTDDPLRERQMFAARELHVRLSFSCSDEVAADLEALIHDFRVAHGPLIPPWIPLMLAMKEACDVWLEQDPERVPIRGAILRRDDYHCMFPGCSRRSTLEGNHVKPRSRGGTNDASNIVTLCFAHHRGVFHEGYARITGEAPHDLRFEIAIQPDGRPLLVTHGNLIVERG